MPSPEKFKESLQKFGVSEAICHEIDAGYETVAFKSPKSARARYFKRAIDILDAQVAPETVQALLDWNACCKTGQRHKAALAFAKRNCGLSLAEKLELIKAERYMGNPALNPDGSITVHAVAVLKDGKYQCVCSNFIGLKRDYEVSRHYCFCCAGHFRFHYETMLGCRLKTVGIESSPLDSNGAAPCVIRFEMALEEKSR